MIEQRVQVKFDDTDRWYTYSFLCGYGYGPLPLNVGERVVTPPNWRKEEEGVATVMALGSDWEGPTRWILRRTEHGQ